MGTKNTTQTTNAYNQGSMGAYNSFQPQLQSYWMQSMQNPFGTSQFQNQLAQSQNMGNQMRQRSMSNSIQNLRAGGGILSNAGGFSTAMINRNAIAGNLSQGNSFNNAVNTALNTRNAASMAMAAYQPLQTGQTSTQTTSGLGTWLPQVAGMALGAASGGLTGGLSGALSGAAGLGGGGGGGSAPSPYINMQRPSGFASAPMQNPYGQNSYGMYPTTPPPGYNF